MHMLHLLHSLLLLWEKEIPQNLYYLLKQMLLMEMWIALLLQVVGFLPYAAFLHPSEAYGKPLVCSFPSLSSLLFLASHISFFSVAYLFLYFLSFIKFSAY